ncbi:CDP-glycerol glycerophosphotransferase family protein [Pedococcus sp. KACC 23699]|uniref:CDP-glycerol glycerophosphotransferase family protein n=1 Tax=Pedococcus sp. KACC 23699 TaxID=3149228 RepID=A0AAU7JW82_9MICO
MTRLPTSALVPDVSVVVIVYNDARRLPTAVRSVLRQTLRNVEVLIADDASTDDTEQVAAGLQAEDDRVRYVRLPQNSGGCGRPRNVGLEHATASTVMFLDSDDRLERHACKNLLEALEDDDSDFAMGLVRRQYTDTGRQTKWYPSLFDTRRVVAGLAEEPDLLQDVLSVNKLYRRSFLSKNGLAFPEDVHYEDQLFSLMAYNAARRISVIPENVYLWRVFPVRASASITQQRHDITNFHHRLEVHRRIDTYLDEHGTPALQRAKDLKFLQNDMRLYLGDIIEGDGTVTAEVLREAEPYLRAIPLDRYEALPPALRAAYGMALRHDLDGLRQVMLLDRRNILAARISTHDGIAYLSNTHRRPGPDLHHPLDAPENTFLQVTGEPILRAPVGTFHLLHELTGVRALPGQRIEVTGRTHDTLGKLAHSGDWSLSVVAQIPDTKDRVPFDVTVTSRGPEEAHWRAILLPSRALTPVRSELTWELWVRTRVGQHASRTPLRWDAGPSVPSAPIHLTARLGQATHGTIGPSATGTAEIVLSSAPGLRRKVTNRIAKRYLPTYEERLRTPWDEVHRARVLRKAYAALRRLPLDRDLVVYEANLGTIYGDSPKYVYEAMRRMHPEKKAVWVLPRGHVPPHSDVTVVRRGTLAYLRALARATYWVDNQTFPRYVRKRPGQRYLQTWHGIPLKKMGKDKLGVRLPPQRPDRGTGAWDELVVPGPYFERTFLPAFDYRGGLVKFGTPRNDALVDGSVTRADARRALDLPQDATVVLYAPTFREDNADKEVAVTVPFDVEALLDGLGDDAYVLLRPHYLNRISVPVSRRYNTLDVSKIEDVNVLYLAADVLITDYSSVMFDYALLGRPIVLYTYDYTEYLAGRGAYLDLVDAAPGPMVSSTEDLVRAVIGVLDDPSPWAERYERFLADYCGQEDGHASERAVEALITGMRHIP